MHKFITSLVPCIVQVITEQLGPSLANELSVPTSSLSAEICEEGPSDASCTFSLPAEASPTSMDSPTERLLLNSKRRVASHDPPDSSLASSIRKTKKDRGVNAKPETAISSTVKKKDELGT